MVLTVPDWLVENVAWVVVATGGVGYGTYLLKRRGGGAMKRMDDKMLDRILTSNESLAKALNNLADSWREQGKCMCDEMKNQTTSIVQMMQAGLRDVHGRIDEMINNSGKSHKTAHRGVAEE